MRKSKHDIVKILDPEDVTDLTEHKGSIMSPWATSPVCSRQAGSNGSPSQQVSTIVRTKVNIGLSRKNPEYLPINVANEYSSPFKTFIREVVFLVLMP